MSGYSETRVDAEVAEWPGAEIARRERTSKHQRLVLRFGGAERFVVYPLTPGDTRGELNHIQSVRQTLRDMGATRNERRKASARRQRNKPHRNPLANLAPAPVKINPFEALQAIEFAPEVPWISKEPMWKRAASGIAAVWRRLLAGFARSTASPARQGDAQ